MKSLNKSVRIQQLHKGGIYLNQENMQYNNTASEVSQRYQ